MQQNEKIVYVGATLHEGQRQIVSDIISSVAMYYTIVTPRQFGKSFMAVQLMLYYALNYPGSKLMFTSPVYSQASKVFKELMDGVRGSGVIKKFNGAENSLIFINGSELFFKSVQLADNLRGYSIDYLFCDEAAVYKEEAFNAVLRPMLTVRGKKCFLFSTPHGKNWFYTTYKKAGENKRYRSYKGCSSLNPYANQEEINDAKRALPEALFRQEYLGEFVDSGGEVFINVNKCAKMFTFVNKLDNIQYYAGIDIGRQNDYTVVTIIGSDNKVYKIHRVNKKGWSQIVQEVANVLKEYNPRYTLVETNGIGDVFFDNLKALYPNITPWITSNSSKQMIIEELILAFQDEAISIPTYDLFSALHDELSDFTFNYNIKTRNISYGARTGHDDTVMSLAIANHARKTGATKGVYAIN